MATVRRADAELDGSLAGGRGEGERLRLIGRAADDADQSVADAGRRAELDLAERASASRDSISAFSAGSLLTFL